MGTLVTTVRSEHHDILNRLTLFQMATLLRALRNPTVGKPFSLTGIGKIVGSKDNSFGKWATQNTTAKSKYENVLREYMHGLMRTRELGEAMVRGLEWWLHNPDSVTGPALWDTYPGEYVPANEQDDTDIPDTIMATDRPIAVDTVPNTTDTDTDMSTDTETFSVQARHAPVIGINALIRFAESAKIVQSDMAALIDKLDELIKVTPAPYMDAVMGIKSAMETQYEALES